VVVPWTTKGRPAINSDIPEQLQQARETIAILSTAQDTAELYREKAGWFIPTYDELSLFLMAATLILLYVANVPMREQIHKWMARHHDIWVYIVAAVFLCGLGLSIYHIFTTRNKTDLEKWGMLIFAVLTNAGTGIIAGTYIIRNIDTTNWPIIFPIWNIVNGALLLLMLRFRIIDEKCISDRDATLVQIILGLVAVLIIFVFCNYVFKLYWAITFSICIIYTTSFDRALQNVFPGLANRPDDQAP
jgi:FtsH-binding integral membrane protein